MDNPLSKIIDCIKDYEIVETNWMIKRWMKVDIEKIKSWYDDLLKNYSDWKWEYGKHNYMWKYDPNEKLGKFMNDDTSWIMLTWGDDRPGPVPWLRYIAKPEFDAVMPEHNLGARECFTGYGLEVIRNFPIPAYDIQVAIHTPGTRLPTHQDSPEKFRFHIPIITNLDARFIINGIDIHLPADGWVYLVNTTYAHSTENNGNSDRVHIYGGVITDDVFKLNLNSLETLI